MKTRAFLIPLTLAGMVGGCAVGQGGVGVGLFGGTGLGLGLGLSLPIGHAAPRSEPAPPPPQLDERRAIATPPGTAVEPTASDATLQRRTHDKP